MCAVIAQCFYNLYLLKKRKKKKRRKKKGVPDTPLTIRVCRNGNICACVLIFFILAHSTHCIYFYNVSVKIKKHWLVMLTLVFVCLFVCCCFYSMVSHISFFLNSMVSCDFLYIFLYYHALQPVFVRDICSVKVCHMYIPACPACLWCFVSDNRTTCLCLSVCLSICLSLYLSIFLSLSLSFFLSLPLSP